MPILGHCISSEGVKPDPGKIKAVKSFPIPLLQFPDFKQPFLVTTDASNYAVGAVLSQGQIGKDLPIAYASRTLNSAEINYSTIEKELLAVVFAVDHFRPGESKFKCRCAVSQSSGSYLSWSKFFFNHGTHH